MGMTSRHLLPFIPQSHVTVVSLSVSTIMRQRFIFGNVDRIVAGNIETISLEMRI